MENEVQHRFGHQVSGFSTIRTQTYQLGSKVSDEIPRSSDGRSESDLAQLKQISDSGKPPFKFGQSTFDDEKRVRPPKLAKFQTHQNFAFGKPNLDTTSGKNGTAAQPSNFSYLSPGENEAE